MFLKKPWIKYLNGYLIPCAVFNDGNIMAVVSLHGFGISPGSIHSLYYNSPENPWSLQYVPLCLYPLDFQGTETFLPATSESSCVVGLNHHNSWVAPVVFTVDDCSRQCCLHQFDL